MNDEGRALLRELVNLLTDLQFIAKDRIADNEPYDDAKRRAAEYLRSAAKEQG